MLVHNVLHIKETTEMFFGQFTITNSTSSHPLSTTEAAVEPVGE